MNCHLCAIICAIVSTLSDRTCDTNFHIPKIQVNRCVNFSRPTGSTDTFHFHTNLLFTLTGSYVHIFQRVLRLERHFILSCLVRRGGRVKHYLCTHIKTFSYPEILFTRPSTPTFHP